MNTFFIATIGVPHLLKMYYSSFHFPFPSPNITPTYYSSFPQWVWEMQCRALRVWGPRVSGRGLRFFGCSRLPSLLRHTVLFASNEFEAEGFYIRTSKLFNDNYKKLLPSRESAGGIEGSWAKTALRDAGQRFEHDRILRIPPLRTSTLS